MQTTNRFCLVLLAALAAMTTGCAFGREVSGPGQWPVVPANKTAEPRKVILSSFFEFEHATATTTSTTGNVEITKILETASIKDISGELATAVTAHGVPAVGRAKFDGAGMAENDLWVRGVAKWGPCLNCQSATIPAIVVFLLTLDAIGGILPFPFPVGYGPRAELRVEVVNAKGDIVMTKTGDGIDFQYNTVYLWPFLGGGDSQPHDGDREEMLDRLAGSIVRIAKQ
jgi:hypothetical protein